MLGLGVLAVQRMTIQYYNVKCLYNPTWVVTIVSDFHWSLNCCLLNFLKCYNQKLEYFFLFFPLRVILFHVKFKSLTTHKIEYLQVW